MSFAVLMQRVRLCGIALAGPCSETIFRAIDLRLLNRRKLLASAGCGFGSLALTDLLRADGLLDSQHPHFAAEGEGRDLAVHGGWS